MRGAWLIGAVLGLVVAQTAAAQSSDELRALSEEVDALKDGQTAIQQELQEIKNLLRGVRAAQPAPAPRAPARAETSDVVVSVEGEPVKGDKIAFTAARRLLTTPASGGPRK